jgi:hypothetical protein
VCGECHLGKRLPVTGCTRFIAQTVTDSARKVVLLDMAQAWAKLAAHIDKDPGEASAASP